MTTKLTLSVKKEVVEKAKRLSAKNGKSVSKMVEEFLGALPETPKKSIVEEIDEIMAPHRERILKSLPKNKSYRDMVRDWRYEDYMKKLAESQPKRKAKTK